MGVAFRPQLPLNLEAEIKRFFPADGGSTLKGKTVGDQQKEEEEVLGLQSAPRVRW